jgi:hypothetical protein
LIGKVLQSKIKEMSIESIDSASPQSSRTGWWTPRLAGPVIAAAVLRLTLLAIALARTGISAITPVDIDSYLIPGRNLLLHGRYIADGVPALWRTPGYSLFLAITSLAGLPVTALANLILSVFTVLLVWKLGLAASDDKRIALVAAWIFAFEPISIVHSVTLMSETLFLVLFLLSLVRLVEFLRVRRLRLLAVAGLWLAAATFVRPVTYYLPIFLALGLFAVLFRVPGLRWKAPAVLLISVLPCLAAWQIRNWVETGYGGFSSAAEINLYYWDAVGVTARVEHRSFSDVQNEFDTRVVSDQTGAPDSRSLVFMRSEALRIIRAHYGVYLRLCFVSLIETAFNPGAGHFDSLLIPGYGDLGHNSGIIDEGPVRWGITLVKTDPWIATEKAAFAVVLLGLYLFAARGVFRGGMHTANLWLLLGTSFYFLAITALIMGVGADARYRLPIMPIVCIFAAAGFQRKKTIAQ